MNDGHFDGVGSFGGGEYNDLDIDGVYTCTGDLKADRVQLDGVFTSKGKLETDLLDCDGVADFTALVKAKRLLVDGVLNVKKAGRIEADEILCNGFINADGEVNADKIEADGYINAGEIVGDHVIIKSRIGLIVKLFSKKLSKVKVIEATTIELRAVKAEAVNGHDIVIGPKCIIENLDCSGTLYIDPTSTVENITGDYSLKGSPTN